LDSLSIRRRRAILVIIRAWTFCIGSKDTAAIITGGSSWSYKIGSPALLESIIPENIRIIFFLGFFSSDSKYSLSLSTFNARHISSASSVLYPAGAHIPGVFLT
jgi:hypothetical protein